MLTTGFVLLAGAHTAANSIHAVLWNILVARPERYRKLLTLDPRRVAVPAYSRGLRTVFADYLGVCALPLNKKRPCRR